MLRWFKTYTDHFISKLIKNLIFCLIIFLVACAGAPVQEMSDARQAVRSAEAARADYHSPIQFLEARQLLEQAQNQLERGNYSEAKRLALSAREEAILAREKAETAFVP